MEFGACGRLWFLARATFGVELGTAGADAGRIEHRARKMHEDRRDLLAPTERLVPWVGSA